MGKYHRKGLLLQKIFCMSLHFQKELKDELDRYLTEQEASMPADNVLKIDLHCHDYNSDVPDELIGRILRVPETWL